MALTKFLTSMDIIAALNDEPNDVGGLTAAQLKAKFDEGCKAIQSFVNGTLTVEADATFATKAEVQAVVLGQIPDGTITVAKLENALATKIGGAAQANDLIDTAINLSDAVKTALALTGTKYVSDALAKLSGAALRSTTGGNKLVDMSGTEFTLPYAKIATGSYTGTGTFGVSNPNLLNIGTGAKFIFVSEAPMSTNGGTGFYVFIDFATTSYARCAVLIGSDRATTIYVKYVDGILYWYDSDQYKQCNVGATNYKAVIVRG